MIVFCCVLPASNKARDDDNGLASNQIQRCYNTVASSTSGHANSCIQPMSTVGLVTGDDMRWTAPDKGYDTSRYYKPKRISTDGSPNEISLAVYQRRKTKRKFKNRQTVPPIRRQFYFTILFYFILLQVQNAILVHKYANYAYYVWFSYTEAGNRNQRRATEAEY